VLRSRFVAPVVAAAALVMAPALGIASPAGAESTTGPPRVSIGGGSVVEGQMNGRYVRFTVTLSWATSVPVTVNYATGDPSDTALATDYKPKSGTLSFRAGAREHFLSVLVRTDTIDEADETFTVRLSNPQNATLGVADATGTIIDDDPNVGRRVSIGDGITPEGCAGRPTHAAVVVTLSSMMNESETVQVTTGPVATAGATASVDYTPLNKTITFTSGQLVKEVRIPIVTDQAVEGTEQFAVTLTVVSGSVLASRSDATVTILDCAPS
jgi:hypothetical protein